MERLGFGLRADLRLSQGALRESPGLRAVAAPQRTSAAHHIVRRSNGEAGGRELARVPQWASTIAGLGVQLVTVWQSKAQLDETYRRQADTILTNHLTKLFYAGLSDQSSVEYASRLLGDEFVAALLDEGRHGRPGRNDRRTVTPVHLGPPHLFRQMLDDMREKLAQLEASDDMKPAVAGWVLIDAHRHLSDLGLTSALAGAQPRSTLE